MKRLYISLVVFAIVVSSVVLISVTAEKKLEETSRAFLACTEKEKNESLDSLKLENAIRVWEKNKRFLLVFSFHSDFSEIEAKITYLTFCSLYPDFEKSSLVSYETGKMLSDVAEDYCVSFENIF